MPSKRCWEGVPNYRIFLSKALKRQLLVFPLGRGVEVFGLPGFEKKRGRYLLSLTNASEAVGKDRSSMLRFLTSKTLKDLLGNTLECCNFNAENVQNSIVGIPPELASIYWTYHLSYRLAGEISA